VAPEAVGSSLTGGGNDTGDGETIAPRTARTSELLAVDRAETGAALRAERPQARGVPRRGEAMGMEEVLRGGSGDTQALLDDPGAGRATFKKAAGREKACWTGPAPTPLSPKGLGCPSSPFENGLRKVGSCGTAPREMV